MNGMTIEDYECLDLGFHGAAEQWEGHVPAGDNHIERVQDFFASQYEPQTSSVLRLGVKKDNICRRVQRCWQLGLPWWRLLLGHEANFNNFAQIYSESLAD